MNRTRIPLTLATGLALSAGTASAVPVDLELVLATDVSDSVTETDFELQRSGFEAAFRNASVIAGITGGAIGSVAVTLVQWSERPLQMLGWTLLDSAASSSAFADAIAAMPRAPASSLGTIPTVGTSTGITNAVVFSTALFDNDFEGTRLVIDISGDGADNVAPGCPEPTALCVALQNARDAFLDAGDNRTINAIWIDDRDYFGDDPEDAINALAYGANNVVGGPNAFQNLVEEFTDFGAGILTKLHREITTPEPPEPPVQAPEPASLALVGLGLAGLGLARRRRRG